MIQIVEKNVNELIPYENNPRKNEHAVKFVANSIEEFGFKVPIIVDKDNVIIAGHTRLLAAKQLGMETVPCVVSDDLTEEQVKAFRIADNKTAEIASFDDELLKIELEDILDDFDMTDFGFGDFEITILTNDFEPEPYDEEMIEQYENNSERILAKKRVIITYKIEDEQYLANMLGLETVQKVLYDIEELMKGRENAEPKE